MAKPVRRNVAHLSPTERTKYIDAVVAADQRFWSGGPISYWDFQDLAHQTTHVHGGPKFLLWHRELCNRWESLLREVDPDVALHYWDWTTDPRSSADGAGGTTDLGSNDFMGTMAGNVAGKLLPLHNQGVFAGSRQQTGLPQDPPQTLLRSLPPGPGTATTDASIHAASNAFPQAQQWHEFRQRVEQVHGGVHVRFGPGNIGDPSGHEAFQDPFVFMLHSNVDRLYAEWQTEPGQEWRLDSTQLYGDDLALTGDTALTGNTVAPWDGTSGAFPFTPAGGLVNVKSYLDPSLAVPPCYDTLPLAVEQVAPAPGDPVRFVDVVEFLPTARALRLRVRGCARVTATATVTAPFTVLSSPVTSSESDGFGTTDLLVWVLFTPGAAGSSANGTLTVTVAPTGDVFAVPVSATVVSNPTVGTSLVLDRSGSMSLPSGLPAKDRMDVLHDSAPLFVTLLDAGDGIGVVRFDTDAVPATPVADAGPMIGGAGRLAASTAITSTATVASGLTAIGDGLEAAAAQLTAAAGNYDTAATIVFTDGFETADKTIAAAASSVNSRVFAVGLGTADQLNPGALSDIANGTGGFLLLTGNPGVDDQVLLLKYFAQVLAGATNAAIVVDPDGFVPSGGKAVIPFHLTAADIRADVLILGEMSSVLHVDIVAPDGTTLSAGSGAEEVVGQAYRVLRVVPADLLAPGAAEGRWEAVLSVDGTELDRWLGALRERLSTLNNKDRAGQALQIVLEGIKAHGVPYTVSVQARSALRLGVALSQTSRLPGTPGRLRAILTDSGIPLSNSATVEAVVTAPDGSTRTLPLSPTGDGEFEGVVATTTSGVYRVLVRAAGTDLRGTQFTREELRTLAVWARGDDAPPLVINPGGGDGSGMDTCGLLLCLLEDDGIRRLLEQHKIDSDRVARCVKSARG